MSANIQKVLPKDLNVLDRFTSIDERMQEQNRLLTKLINVMEGKPIIPSRPSLQQGLPAPGGPIDRELKPSLEMVFLHSIDRNMRILVQGLVGVNMTERIDISIQYPPDGGTRTVNKGDITVNIFEGKILLPDGTEEELSDSLKAHDRLFARSFNIKSDKGIKYALDNGGFANIDANDNVGETYQNFSTMRLKILEDSTAISLWFCSNPQSIKKILGVENIATPSSTVSAYGKTTVGTEVVELRAASTTRLSFTFRNDDDSNVLYFGKDALITTSNSGGYLDPNDSYSYNLSNGLYRGPVFVRASGADTDVFWEEVG